MRIDYFEEFLGPETLDWIRRVPGPSRLILAAPDLQEFRSMSARIQGARADIAVAYWPIVPRSYWVSPFSYKDDIETVMQDLSAAQSGDEVMFDLELPILSKDLFYRNLPGFLQKKRLIRETMRDLARRDVRVLTAEYPPPGRLAAALLRMLGVSFAPLEIPYTRIVMYYTSMIPKGWIADTIRDQIRRDARRYGPRFQAGVGTIAKGILGDEPVLPPADLEKDLAFLRDAGVDTAVVFRLGGLDEEYLRVIQSFQR